MPGSATGSAGVHHETGVDDWQGPTGIYDDDLRAPLSREDAATWAPICVWAKPQWTSDTMSLTFKADTSLAPPSDRQYSAELIFVPAGIAGAPAVGTTWPLPLSGQTTITLPTYRTDDGTTAYRFSFTVSAAEAQPGDLNNDGKVNIDDFGVLVRCFCGPGGVVGPACSAIDLSRSDLNEDGCVDLFDVGALSTLFSPHSTPIGNYAGEASCRECHGSRHGSWSDTRHAGAMQTLRLSHDEANSDCLPCHVTGYDRPEGYVDLDETPHLASVQCEVCHGPSGPHVSAAGTTPSSVKLDARLCGDCHQSCHGLCGDYYHPHFEQWSLSRHAAAISDIHDRADYDRSCLPCHSTEYRLADPDNPPSPENVRLGLQCVDCHDPHSPAIEHQLRLDPPALCAQCHSAEDAGPGALPEHPQYDFVRGRGGYTLDGLSMDGEFDFVFAELDGMCAFCHVYREDYAGPEQPANSGHTFEPNTRACQPCHAQQHAIDRLASLQAEIAARSAAIAPFLDPEDPQYVDPDELSPTALDAYLIAVFDYNLVLEDRSLGLHNPYFARKLLDQVERFFGISP